MRHSILNKELQDNLGLNWIDYGARYYAAWIGRFVSVDPLKEERQWVSPYNYCQNNPINRTDTTGALDKVPDWFQNEVTGDIHYNSEWKKGDESQLGENWVWMGENGMFSETKEEIQKGIEKGVFKNADWAYNYPNKGIDGDITYGQILDFSGKNAENFMAFHGFSKLPTQVVEYTQETETKSVLPGGLIISWKSGRKIQINEKYKYFKKVYTEVNRYEIIPPDYMLGIYALSSERVARKQIQYSNNRTKIIFVKTMDLVIPLSGDHEDFFKIVHSSWNEYPENNKMINDYKKQWGTK